MALALTCVSAHAALQGRDFDGNPATIEGYYDTTLNITWLADASYSATSGGAGAMNWWDANAWAASLNVNGIAGWRLPNTAPVNGLTWQSQLSIFGCIDGSKDACTHITSPNSELSYMYNVNLGLPSPGGVPAPTVTTAGGAVFSGVQSYAYWSRTDQGTDSPANYAWFVDFSSGTQYFTDKTQAFNAWAVHDGAVGAPVSSVPEPETALMLTAGLAVLAARARRQSGRQ